jgi:hypothetical protein
MSVQVGNTDENSGVFQKRYDDMEKEAQGAEALRECTAKAFVYTRNSNMAKVRYSTLYNTRS